MLVPKMATSVNKTTFLELEDLKPRSLVQIGGVVNCISGLEVLKCVYVDRLPPFHQFVLLVALASA
jgi:hypothetical protein